MSYLSLKMFSKKYNFLGVVNKKDLLAYARQYVKKEQILTIYKTARDYGIFTDKKIVLFDNKEGSKQISVIPYKSISYMTIIFNNDSARLNLFLNNGHSIYLNFIKMTGDDKLRLRVLYNCIDKLLTDQKPIDADVKNLINDTVKL